MPPRFFVLLFLLMAPIVGRAQTPKPNVVVIFADDLGYGDPGVYGGKKAPTPAIDRLAAEGLRATDFYVAQPVCSASRAALVTGRYPHRVGIAGALGPRSAVGIKASETTLAEIAKSAGYATAIFGKWHLGDRPETLPLSHGFDEFWGIPYSHDMWPSHPETPKAYPPLPVYDGKTVVMENPDPGIFTQEITRRATAFIERNVAKPFFLYVPHPLPHVPLGVAKENRPADDTNLYGAVLREIDDSVAAIVAALEKGGILDRTLIIFSSDNGPWLSYGPHAGSAGPLREGKGTTFEGGIRVPFLARLPSLIKPGTIVREPFMTIDVLPTVARLMGVTQLPDRLDGRDCTDLWRDPTAAKSPHEALFFYYENAQLQAVRSGNLKLHLEHGYRSMEGRDPGKGGKPGSYDYARRTGIELYDLAEDIGETKNLADQRKVDVQRLLALVAEQKKADEKAASSK